MPWPVSRAPSAGGCPEDRRGIDARSEASHLRAYEFVVVVCAHRLGDEAGDAGRSRRNISSGAAPECGQNIFLESFQAVGWRPAASQLHVVSSSYPFAPERELSHEKHEGFYTY